MVKKDCLDKKNIKVGYMYKDACPCSLKKKTLYETGIGKVKRREIKNERRRSIK